MANSTDYLRFSAYSIKDLITRKLSDNSKFTDQIYEGSNLAILIDIVSYMYQCLMYNLNNAAAESMWSDTQIYENINRLCKFIGYNPKGWQPATAQFVLDSNQLSGNVISIPQYAAIDTGKTDDNGRKVYYSTVDAYTTTHDSLQTVMMYNGIWKLYSTVFSGNDQEYQTLLLDGLKSDSLNQNFVASEFIHVYVQDDTGNLKKWTRTDQGVFTDNKVDNGSAIYDQNSTIYNVRLNEDKTYEISFGNGFNGKKPGKGKLIYVFYLDSNGPSGKIEMGEVKDKTMLHSQMLFGLNEEIYNQVFLIDNEPDLSQLKWKNITNSSDGAAEESVEDIRRNAPEWFKTGNRLVTSDDWQYYVKNAFKDNILDVVCENNWQYMTTFYRWLYNLGLSGMETKHKDTNGNLLRSPNARYYIDQSKLMKNDFKYADAADCNNVYLWIKMKNDADIYKDMINERVQNVKVITQQPVYMKPLDVYFAICAQDKDNCYERYFMKSDSKQFDPDNESYLEVTIDDNTLYANIDMTNKVKNVIRQFFNENNFTLGQIVDYSKLTEQIYALGSISRLRTIWRDPESGQEIILPGVAFATWTAQLIDIGDDLDVSTTSRSLESFQFPRLYKSGSIENKIKIIRKTIGNNTSIQY